MSQIEDLSMRIVPVAAPVRTQVVESLRHAITAGRLKPGTRLVEKDLCQMLGVSRPSVREALRALEAEGLISTIPNRGPVVTLLSREDAAGIYQVREALESLAAELFTVNASDSEIADLQRAAVDLASAYETKSVNEIIEAKRVFYDVIFQGSGNNIIPEILRTLNARITKLRSVSLSSPKRRAASIDEIKKLVAALASRDGPAAVKASRKHVAKAASEALSSLPA